MTIEYRDSINNILVPEGFFIGWQSKPSYKTFKAILHGSDYVIVAVDVEVQKLAGFITAISDGVLSAYIPLLEVRPEYQQHGIGTELVKRMLRRLKGLYMIDLVCEPSVKSFYKRFGMRESLGMSIRNYKKQSGRQIFTSQNSSQKTGQKMGG